MEMSLNTNGPSYCTSKGELIAYNIDDGVAAEKKFFKRYMYVHLYDQTESKSFSAVQTNNRSPVAL